MGGCGSSCTHRAHEKQTPVLAVLLGAIASASRLQMVVFRTWWESDHHDRGMFSICETAEQISRALKVRRSRAPVSRCPAGSPHEATEISCPASRSHPTLIHPPRSPPGSSTGTGDLAPLQAGTAMHAGCWCRGRGSRTPPQLLREKERCHTQRLACRFAT